MTWPKHAWPTKKCPPQELRQRIKLKKQDQTLRIYRGDKQAGEMVDYTVPVAPGMVVLDAIHEVQARHASDLAVRWNCKAGRCGSCSAEVNGRPRLTCMDRLDKYPADEPIVVRPMKAFPVIKDLACDVSWNFRVNKKDPRVSSSAPTGRGSSRRPRPTACRSSASASSAFSARTSATCCATTTARRSSAGRGSWSAWPGWRCTRSTPATALPLLKNELGIGYCNITKCCTEVCPESIKITDNAIIPLKERVVDEFYDPIKKLLQILSPRRNAPPPASIPTRVLRRETCVSSKRFPEMAVPAALEKALRYRLLNEPLEAESIWLDVLRVDPDNEEALVMLLLARTDLFDDEYVAALERAKAVLPRLAQRLRPGLLRRGDLRALGQGSGRPQVPGHVVTGWYLHAMHCFERAEALAGAENPDAILRWNTCARWLERHADVAVEDHSLTRDVEMEFGEEVQTR